MHILQEYINCSSKRRKSSGCFRKQQRIFSRKSTRLLLQRRKRNLMHYIDDCYVLPVWMWDGRKSYQTKKSTRGPALFRGARGYANERGAGLDIWLDFLMIVLPRKHSVMRPNQVDDHEESQQSHGSIWWNQGLLTLACHGKMRYRLRRTGRSGEN